MIRVWCAMHVYVHCSQPLVVRYTRQLVQGVAYLHSKNIVHRDVKPANIMLTLSDDVKRACARAGAVAGVVHAHP